MSFVCGQHLHYNKDLGFLFATVMLHSETIGGKITHYVFNYFKNAAYPVLHKDSDLTHNFHDDD